MKKLSFISLSFILFLFIACQKDNINEISQRNSINESLLKNGGQVGDYNRDLMSDLDKNTIILSKIIAYQWMNDEQFGKMLLHRIIDENGVPKSVFMSDIVNNVVIKNTEDFLEKLRISKVELQSALSAAADECNLLVVKLPAWTAAYWSGENEPMIDFSYENMRKLNFLFFPRTLSVPEDKVWRGYDFSKGKEEIEYLKKGSYPQNYLPILIRVSDTHVFINPENYEGKNGEVLTNQNLDVIPETAPCHPKNVIQKYYIKKCGEFVVVPYIEYMDALTNRCVEVCGNNKDDDYDGLVDEKCVPNNDEICDNGIDDDGDGLVDCEDSDCCGTETCGSCVEICDNDLDDDNDGFIDELDSDCCSFYAHCLRDCKTDANFIEGIRFVDETALDIVTTNSTTDIIFDEGINMKLEFLFINGALATYPFTKSIPARLYSDLCTGGDNTLTGSSLGNSLFGLGRSTVESGAPSHWVIIGTYTPPGGIPHYVFIRKVFTRKFKFPYLPGDWDGSLYGDLAACKVIASDLTLVNAQTNQTSDQSVITTSFSATTGLKIGFGGDFGATGGFLFDNSLTFGNSNVTTVEAEQSYTINLDSEVEIGDILFPYCDANSSLMFEYPTYPPCLLNDYNFEGQEKTTGSMIIYTSIETE